MEIKRSKEREFEHGAYFGCAMISWVFVCLIILSGFFGYIYLEKVSPPFISLFIFFITTALGLAVYYSYKVIHIKFINI